MEVLFVCLVYSLSFCAGYVNLTGLSVKIRGVLGKNTYVVFTYIKLAGKVILNNQRNYTEQLKTGRFQSVLQKLL